MSKIEELANTLNLTVNNVSNQLDSIIWYYQTTRIMSYLFLTSFIIFSIYFCKSTYKIFISRQDTYDFDKRILLSFICAIVALAFFIVIISTIANTVLLFTDPQSWLLVKIISAS